MNTAKPTLDLNDYVAILWRHKLHFLVPFITILTLGVVLALALPAVYKSQATILIERQEIPSDVVETTVTGFIQERIETLSKRILTIPNLWAIAEKHDLFPEERSIENKQEIATLVRDSTFVAMEDVRASDTDSMKQVTATIAFTVAFEYSDPAIAQSVTADLAQLFLEENQRLRTEKTADVVKFLESESERLNTEISELEAKLADFKQEQREQLPELMNMNLSLYEKTDAEIGDTEDRIRTLEDQINAVRAELALTDPHQAVYDEDGKRIQTSSERLSMLTSDYIRLSSTYSQTHPDVKKVKREIEALGGQSADTEGVMQLVSELTVLRGQLSEARQKYSEDHPDVVKLKASISAVEKGLRSASGTPVATGGLAHAPDNPQYVALQTQLQAAERSLASERNKLTLLQDKLQDYEERLFQTPVVERDYKILSRDYDNARSRYHEIKSTLLEARLAEQLEAGSKGERFTIVQNATAPVLPERPNRVGIVLLSIFFGAVVGLGAVAFVEYNDHTIHGSRGVQAVFDAPPLAIIPSISVPPDAKRRRVAASERQNRAA